MKKLTVIAAALLLAQQVQATTLSGAATLAEQTSPGSTSEDFKALTQQILQAERKALRQDAPTLSRAQLEQAKQSTAQADSGWLAASGYNFQVADSQQAGIDLLSGFSALPASVLQANLATVTAINHHAPRPTQHQALSDAEGISYLYFTADALGPRLGRAFLTAYDKGELNKAAALIKATEISTSAAKKHFHYPRPFQVEGNSIKLVADDVVVQDNHPYTADGGAFPSGHTNTGITDTLLLAEMIPERFAPLLARGARYGYSRVVLGVHYPLDVMGSRMAAQRNVAHYLNDPAYRKLFDEARSQLRSALEKECGSSLAACAETVKGDDPYQDPAMTRFYRFTMTYDLPQQQTTSAPALSVPQGADVLLESALPKLSAAQRQELMVRTALPGGFPLSGTTADQQFWQRLDLHAAFLQGEKEQRAMAASAK